MKLSGFFRNIFKISAQLSVQREHVTGRLETNQITTLIGVNRSPHESERKSAKEKTAFVRCVTHCECESLYPET